MCQRCEADSFIQHYGDTNVIEVRARQALGPREPRRLFVAEELMENRTGLGYTWNGRRFSLVFILYSDKHTGGDDCRENGLRIGFPNQVVIEEEEHAQSQQ